MGKLVHRTESRVARYNMKSSSEWLDLKTRLLKIELDAWVDLGAQMPLKDLASLRARLNRMKSEGPAEIRTAAAEAVDRLDRCEAWSLLIPSWERYLERLRGVEADARLKTESTTGDEAQRKTKRGAV